LSASGWTGRQAPQLSTRSVSRPIGVQGQEANALYILAEMSIGLAGSTGVVAALHGRDDWYPLDVWRVVNRLLVGFRTLVLALVPVALRSFGITGSPPWRISSRVS
jgi:hypothetical protein